MTVDDRARWVSRGGIRAWSRPCCGWAWLGVRDGFRNWLVEHVAW